MIQLKDKRLIDQLKAKKVPHRKVSTNATVKYYVENETKETFMLSTNILNYKCLSLIKAIEKYVLNNVDFENVPAHKNINYFNFKNLQNGTFKDFIEIDVNAAYFNIALQKGYIDKKIFDKAFEDTSKTAKIGRLVSLGNLATRKIYETYNIHTATYEVTDVTEKSTKKVFFDISKELSDIMNYILKDIIPTDQTAFFWVDAIFCHKNHETAILNFLSDNDLTAKKYDLKSVEITDQNEFVKKCITEKEQKDEKKQYFFADNLKKFASLQKLYNVENHKEIITTTSKDAVLKLIDKLNKMY